MFDVRRPDRKSYEPTLRVLTSIGRLFESSRRLCVPSEFRAIYQYGSFPLRHNDDGRTQDSSGGNRIQPICGAAAKTINFHGKKHILLPTETSSECLYFLRQSDTPRSIDFCGSGQASLSDAYCWSASQPSAGATRCMQYLSTFLLVRFGARAIVSKTCFMHVVNKIIN